MSASQRDFLGSNLEFMGQAVTLRTASASVPPAEVKFSFSPCLISEPNATRAPQHIPWFLVVLILEKKFQNQGKNCLHPLRHQQA